MTTKREALRTVSARVLGARDKKRAADTADLHKLATLAQEVTSKPLGSQTLDELRTSSYTGTTCVLTGAQAHELRLALGDEQEATP